MQSLKSYNKYIYRCYLVVHVWSIRGVQLASEVNCSIKQLIFIPKLQNLWPPLPKTAISIVVNAWPVALIYGLYSYSHINHVKYLCITRKQSEIHSNTVIIIMLSISRNAMLNVCIELYKNWPRILLNNITNFKQLIIAD